MAQSIEERIRTLVIDLFLGGDGAFPLEDKTHLIESGVCDSLGLVRLAADLEKQFAGLRIQDQDITHENMGTIAAIAALIRRRGVPE